MHAVEALSFRFRLAYSSFNTDTLSHILTPTGPPPTSTPPLPQIERVDDTTFRCYVGQLSFLNFSVEPVITVSVTVEARGCTIRLLSCRLQGSRLVEEVNDKFTAQVRALCWPCFFACLACFVVVGGLVASRFG